MKRGQAVGAAFLVGIIAVLLIAFVILLPPQDRADLLDQDSSSSTSSSVSGTNLLRETPGRVDYLSQRRIEHPLPVVNVFTRTEGRVLAQKNSAYAKRGAFVDEGSTFTFSVQDLEHTDNVYLGFTVSDHKGLTMITLNGENVFTGTLTEGSITPILLPKNLLQRDNTLSIAVESPGLAFWVTNVAELQDLKIVGDVTDIGGQSSRHTFIVSETELNNMDHANLKFQPSCVQQSVGKLTIRINGNEIYSAIPDCALTMVPIQFSSDLLFEGENDVVFSADAGTYVLSHVVVESKLHDVQFPTYYFDVSNEEYESVTAGNDQLRLQLSFVDVVTRKTGDVVFNGHTRRFETREVSYAIDVSDDIVRGSNSVKIRPRRTLEVRELRVDLVD